MDGGTGHRDDPVEQILAFYGGLVPFGQGEAES